MKTTIFALIALSFCIQARSTSLTTIDGVTYNNITTQRVDPDGLYIEYATSNGGVGMSKVKFSRLSADQQKQFGFDATKAHNYEVQVAKANEDFRQESARFDQIVQATARAREERDEKALNDRMVAMSQFNASQITPPPDSVPGYNYSYGGYYDGGAGLIGIPNNGRVPPATRVYAPNVRPIPFPQINTPNNNVPHNSVPHNSAPRSSSGFNR